MTAEAFGEKLRGDRERRGVSLQTIADESRINRGLFADLERGDVSRWPGGIYARAYMRTYASAIGQDSEELAALFCETFPEFAPPAAIPADEIPPSTPGASARRGRLSQLRDLLHRADGRLDLFFGIERSD